VSETFPVKIIAHIKSDFPTKFGIPHQSGVIETLKSSIVFCPEYRNPDALRGLEGFSHIWLIWQFSQAVRDTWQPTVRPPRLGGNTRMGVFATRSPFRPNAIGLSSVKLEGIDFAAPDGPILIVSGADLMDGTPILDIKPYLAYTDSHPEASAGFTQSINRPPLKVSIPPQLLCLLPEHCRSGLTEVLQSDPRPSYQHDPERIYGFEYAGFNIKFRVDGSSLTVVSLTEL